MKQPPKRSYKPSMSRATRNTPQIGLNIGFDIRSSGIAVADSGGGVGFYLVTDTGQPIALK